MKIKTNTFEDKTVILPAGMIDTASSIEFEKTLDKVLNHAGKIKIDFSKVEYISSSGLRVLLKAQKKINTNRGELSVTHLNDSVKKVFEVTGFMEILNIR